MALRSLLRKHPPAILALADGSVFSGISIGKIGETIGEVVFNTSMTGYQEILSDPSYAQQIVTLTYPHIGNVGVNPDDQESNQIWAAGLVIRELSPIVSNWRATQSLTEYLQANNKVAIADIDTRRLTRILREKGAQHGCIMSGDVDPAIAIEKARSFPGLKGLDLAKVVSISSTREWNQNTLTLNSASNSNVKKSISEDAYHVVVYDFGVKYQILRLLVNRGCRVTVVPAQTSADSVMGLNPDGVVLSNGPGDPAACDYAIRAIRQLLENNIPLFGICLGFQLLALACGGQTTKMKFGHHGANHPVVDLESKRVLITSQNHGFDVDEKSLPVSLKITHRSLFDGTLQGLQHVNKPAFAFQGHPEASPGPQDVDYLFDRFVAMMKTVTSPEKVRS